MTPGEQAALLAMREKDERVLIYANLLNGAHVLQLMKAFQKSEKEIMDIFRHVSQKIFEYVFVRKLPPVYCDCIAVAQKNRSNILPLLVKINLDKPSTVSRPSHTKFGGGVPPEAMIDLLREQRH